MRKESPQERDELSGERRPAPDASIEPLADKSRSGKSARQTVPSVGGDLLIGHRPEQADQRIGKFGCKIVFADSGHAVLCFNESSQPRRNRCRIMSLRFT
jgi:hypothetical protein